MNRFCKMQKNQGFIDGYEVIDKEYLHFQLTYDKPWYSASLGYLGNKAPDDLYC